MNTTYRWDYVKLAEVFRKTRKHLRAEKIEHVYSVMIVLKYLIEMLLKEPAPFSRAIFMNYINTDGDEKSAGSEAKAGA